MEGRGVGRAAHARLPGARQERHRRVALAGTRDRGLDLLDGADVDAQRRDRRPAEAPTGWHRPAGRGLAAAGAIRPITEGDRRAVRDRTHVAELRPSQLMHTYGVGATVELPELTTLVLGLED